MTRMTLVGQVSREGPQILGRSIATAKRDRPACLLHKREQYTPVRYPRNAAETRARSHSVVRAGPTYV